MAKFKTEIASDLREDLYTFLDARGLTKAEFLKIAILAKESLISTPTEAVSKPSSASKTTRKPVSRKPPEKKSTAAAIRKASVKTSRKAVAKKTVSTKTKASKPSARTKSSASSSILKKILETNQKLFDRFVAQAKKKRMSQQAYAQKLGLDLKKIERIQKDKSISFVPKLKDALDENQ